jgi:hypothetical protein
MFTYKLGNKADVIIRSVDAGLIGNYKFHYKDEPYTILKEKDVEIGFTSLIKEIKTTSTKLQYSQDYPDTITVSNVELNDKILNLIYEETTEGACTIAENYNSDSEGYVYINKVNTKLFHIFAYDETGSLEFAISESDDDVFKVKNPNSNYLFIYSYQKKGYTLKPLENIYVCLDINSVSNIDDITTTDYYHFGCCALQVNKNMFFRHDSNSIDLIFKIIDLEDTTIVIERS